MYMEKGILKKYDHVKLKDNLNGVDMTITSVFLTDDIEYAICQWNVGKKPKVFPKQ